MAISNQWLEVDFGAGFAGAATGYQFRDNTGALVGSRITAGVNDLGNGQYGALVASVPTGAVQIRWDTGGGTPVYAAEDLDTETRLDASFADGAIWMDVDNGADTNPGTAVSPVQTIGEAVTKAASNTLRKIMLQASNGFPSYIQMLTGAVLAGHDYVGMSKQFISIIPIGTGLDFSNTRWENVLFGFSSAHGANGVDGHIELFRCAITAFDCGGISPVGSLNLVAEKCLFEPGGETKIASFFQSRFFDCEFVTNPGSVDHIINLQGLGASLFGASLVGALIVKNVSNAGAECLLELESGRLTIDSSCTAGTITVRGSCELVDNSAGSTVTDLRAETRQDTQLAADHGAGAWDDSASYDAIWLDVDNGNDANPGSPDEPVLTMAQAITNAIATTRRTINVGVDAATFVVSVANGQDLRNLIYRALSGNAMSYLFIGTSVDWRGTVFQDWGLDNYEDWATLGLGNGFATFEDCGIGILLCGTQASGNAINCAFDRCYFGATGVMQIANYFSYKFSNCEFDTQIPATPFEIDLQNEAGGFFMSNCKGIVKIKNAPSNATCVVELAYGELIIDATCDARAVTVFGQCNVVNENSESFDDRRTVKSVPLTINKYLALK